MLWLIVSPLVVVSSLLCASLCIVARDSDKVMEDLNDSIRRLNP